MDGEGVVMPTGSKECPVCGPAARWTATITLRLYERLGFRVTEDREVHWFMVRPPSRALQVEEALPAAVARMP